MAKRLSELTITRKILESFVRIVADSDGNKRKGIVGAWVKLPNTNRYIEGRSHSDPDPITGELVWTHGERDAINAALKHYYGDNVAEGTKLPKGCEIIVTLEPCTKPMTDRVGCSCSDLLTYHGIDRAYVGIPDDKHFKHGTPPVHKFEVVWSENRHAVSACEHLRSLLPEIV